VSRLERAFLAGFGDAAAVLRTNEGPRPACVPEIYPRFMSERALAIQAFVDGPLESPYTVSAYAGAIAGYAAAFGG